MYARRRGRIVSDMAVLSKHRRCLLDGFGELFRMLSFETIGTSSLQSRCLAGVANGTIVFVLPGSLDAVQTAWDRLIKLQLDSTTKPCNLVQLMPRLREPVDQPATS